MKPSSPGSNLPIDRLTRDPALCRTLFEGAPCGILVVDRRKEVVYANPTLCGWLRASLEEIVGKRCHQVLFGAEEPCRTRSAGCPAEAALRSRRPEGPIRLTRQGPSGAQQMLRVVSHPVLDASDGSASCAVAFLHDETAERMIEAFKEEAALRDPLTGLYNQQGFNHHMGRELSRMRRQGHALSLCLLDLDSFKDYNTRKGRQEGDRLLERFAGILTSQTRHDVDLLFRLQADTFAALLPEATHEQTLGIAKRIREAAARDRFPIPFSVAVGEAGPGSDAEAFYHRTADTLFQAKKAGGNRIL